jgi:hypothetical protein
VEALKNLLKTGSIARVLTFAGLLRPKASRKRPARLTALVLLAALFVNSLGQAVAGQERPRPESSGLGAKAGASLIVVALVGTFSGIGAGIYFAVQHAHTVKGCVIDNPNGLLLQMQDGKTYVLLGATTNIKADERIKVTGTRRKKIPGLTDQPTFVVEKLDKVYGTCSVAPVTP